MREFKTARGYEPKRMKLSSQLSVLFLENLGNLGIDPFKNLETDPVRPLILLAIGGSVPKRPRSRT